MAGEYRNSQQPHRGQPQRPSQYRPSRRPPQYRSTQPARPSKPAPYRRRKRKSKKPIILGTVIALILILIIVISVCVHNARETARLEAQIKANAAAVTPFNEQVASASTVDSETIERNTTAMVDYLIASAHEPATNENAKSNAENSYNWIIANVDNFFTDNLTMEKAIYSGAIVEYYYTGRDEIRASVGMDTVQAVKYVYRGIETIFDDATQENIRQIKESLAKDQGN